MYKPRMFLFRILFQNDMVLDTEMTNIVIHIDILADDQYAYWEVSDLDCKSYLFRSIHSNGFLNVLLDDPTISQMLDMRSKELKIR